MENQHRLIKGYRELTQIEIDLMNRIKAKGREMLELQKEVLEYLENQVAQGGEAVFAHLEHTTPNRWAALAKTDFQTGTMALVRAVAQPTD